MVFRGKQFMRQIAVIGDQEQTCCVFVETSAGKQVPIRFTDQMQD